MTVRSLVEVLELRPQSTASEAIRLAIEGTNDLDTLDRWFTSAVAVGSWAAFESAMHPQ